MKKIILWICILIGLVSSVSAGTITKYVSSSEDDCDDREGSYSYTRDELYAGADWVHQIDQDYETGARFINIQIPQNATITSAYLGRYAGSDSGCNPPKTYARIRINGFDEDNTADFTSNPFSRDRTTAEYLVDWSGSGAAQYNNHEVTDVVEEIINRGGWTAGNALGIWIDDRSPAAAKCYAISEAWDDAGTHPFRLQITSPNITYPQYSTNSTNSTLAGTDVKHSLKWTATYGLSGYTFSFDNCTGSFVNDSFVSMTGTLNWSNVTKSINSTVGCTIKWKVYANNTHNRWNTSLEYSYVTTSAVTYPIFRNTSDNSSGSANIGDTVLFKTEASDPDGLSYCWLTTNETGSWENYSTWCYQETANESSVCGGLDTGGYNWTGDWRNLASCNGFEMGDILQAFIDESWDCSTYEPISVSYTWINYSRPFNYLNTSLWYIGHLGSNSNETIPPSCLDQEPLQFRVGENTSYYSGNQTWECWNGTNWDMIENRNDITDLYIEEAMWWDLRSIQNMSSSSSWQWVNFTFQNSTFIGDLGWRIYCDDTNGNINNTGIQTFTFSDIENPTFDHALANFTIEQNDSFSYDINASDNIAVDCFTVNDTTNFKINCTGYLENNTLLSAIAIYYLNITVNDTSNNVNSSIMFVNVTAAPVDSCTPTTGQNWDLNLADHCNNTIDRDVLKINMYGSGTFANYATISCKNITGPDFIFYANESGVFIMSK